MERTAVTDEEQWKDKREQAVSEWDQIELQLRPDKRPESDGSATIVNAQSQTFQELWPQLCNQISQESKERAKSALDAAEQSKRSKRSCTVPCVNIAPMIRSHHAILPSNLEQDRLNIVALAKTAYASDPLHWTLLQSVYQHISGTNGTVARIGAHWEEIGFQGNDPATDLRGVGICGLLQLLYLSSEGLSKDSVQKLLTLSQHQSQSFPLCVVGLNFTKLLMDLLKAGKLNRLSVKHNSCIASLNLLYRSCFIKFYHTWTDRQCTIQDFGSVLQELTKDLKKRRKSLLNMTNI